jgi:protocatechuate 3,4-dioxygenase beta subunit
LKPKLTLVALSILVLVALVAGALVLGGGPLAGLFGHDATTRRNESSVAHGTNHDDEENAADQKFEFVSEKTSDGKDELGPYRLTKDGRKIYVDEKGNPLRVQPGKGNPFRAPSVSERGRSSNNANSANGGASGTNPGKPGDGTKEDPKEEEAKQAAVTGRVLNDAGEPIKAATVTIAVGAGSTPPLRTSTDENGAFRLDGLPIATPLSVSASDGKTTSKPVNTRLTAGNNALGDFVIPRDAGIRGIVKSSENGGPVEGAQVTLQTVSGWNPKDLKSATTSQRGTFEFAPLTPGIYRVRVSREGFTPRILNNVSVPSDLTVDLSPGVVIAGTVLSEEDSKPISGAVIYCDFHSEPNQSFHTETISEADGTYAVKCQPESVHNQITCLASGYAQNVQQFIKSGVSDLVIRLKRSSLAVVKGRLIDANQQPVTSATFSAQKADNKNSPLGSGVGPGSDGRFWREVALDAATFAVAAPGKPVKKLPITPIAGEELDLGDIMLATGVALFGRITEEGTNAPIEGAKVSAEGRSSLTDATGAYRLEGMPEVDFIVGVNHAAHLGWAGHVVPTQGQTQVELNVELRKTEFKARVHVTDSVSGEPIEGVAINVIDYGTNYVTDAAGMATLTGLSSYKPKCTFTKTGYVPVTAEVTTVLNAELETKPPTEIKLVQGSGVHGRCTTLGTPLPGGTLLDIWFADAQGALSRPAEAAPQLDTDGRYTTNNLPPGKYFIGIPAYHTAARPVTVPTEGGATLDFEIGAVCHLRGTIKRADGSAHANAGIYLHSKANLYSFATVYTNPSGEFEATNLWAGTFMLSPLKSQGDSSAQFSLEVTLSEAGWTTKNFTLPQATGVVEGRVTYTDGAPVVGARISITDLDIGWERACLAAYVVTDANGNYRAERMENGHSVLARVGGYGDNAETATAFSETVVVPNNSEPVKADIVVARQGVNLSGKVRRADGGPLPAGTILYLVDAQGRLSGLYFGGGGASGGFNIGDVPPGTYRLIACCEAMIKAEINVQVGSANVANLDVPMSVER